MNKNFPQKILFFLASLPFLFPFVYFWRWPIGHLGSINCLDFFLGLFILFSLFLLFYQSFFSVFIAFCWENLFFILFFALFLLFSFFNVLRSPIFWDSLGLWKSLFFLPGIFAWLLFFWQENKEISLKKLLNLFYLSTTLLAGWGFFSWLKSDLTYDHRLRLFFSSPNQLAIGLAPAIFIGLQKIKSFWHQKKAGFYLFFSSTCLIFFSLWQTHSLAVLVSFPLVFLCLFFFYQKKATFLLIYLFFSFFILFGWTFFLEKINYIPHIPPTSTDSRIIIWKVSQKIIQKNWSGGIGLGNFQNTYLSYQRFFPPFPQWAVPHGHNLLFTLWSELGFVNLTLFLGLVFISLHQKQKRPSLWSLWLFYFLIYGLIETPLWKNDLAILFWLAIIGSQIDTKKSA